MKTKKLLLLIAFFASIFTVFPAEVAQTNEIIITGSSGTPNGPPRVPSAPSLHIPEHTHPLIPAELGLLVKQ